MVGSFWFQFIIWCLHVAKLKISSNKSHTELEEIISEVVYGTPAQEEKIRAMLKLATDTQFGRGNLVELLTKLGAPPNVPPK